MLQPAVVSSFIGSPVGVVLLAGLSPNLGTRILAEIGIPAGAAGAIYVLHHSIYKTIVQASPPGETQMLSLVAVAMFVAAYAAFRLAVGLRNARGGWGGRSWKAAAAATMAFAVVVAFAAAYPYVAEIDRSQEAGLGAPVKHAESNPAEPGPSNLVIRSETTGEIWVIEAERVDDSWVANVDRDTVYLASATIVGLATFGSLVTIRALGKPKTRRARKWGSVLMFGGAISVVIYQSSLMYGACCGSVNAIQFTGSVLLTVGAMITISLGFVLVMDAWLKDEEDPSNTPG